MAAIEGSLELLSGVHGVTYSWAAQEHGHDRRAGLMAQEVRRTMGEAVVSSRDGSHLEVSYGQVVPVVLESVKALRRLSDESEQLLSTLRSRGDLSRAVRIGSLRRAVAAAGDEMERVFLGGGALKRVNDQLAEMLVLLERVKGGKE